MAQLRVFDKDQQLFYRGQMDDSRPDSGIPVTGKDLRKAQRQGIDRKIAGQSIRRQGSRRLKRPLVGKRQVQALKARGTIHQADLQGRDQTQGLLCDRGLEFGDGDFGRLFRR